MRNQLLSNTHTSLNNIHDVVAQFLTFLYDIHIQRTSSVAILMLVDIIDILCAQLRTIVVDVTFNSKGTVHVDFTLMLYQYNTLLFSTANIRKDLSILKEREVFYFAICVF